MRNKLFSLLSVILIMLFVVAGCNENTMKLELPEGITLVDEKLDAKKLKINSNVEFYITIPENMEIEELLVNNVDIKENVINGKFSLKIEKGLKITVRFKEIEEPQKYTITLGPGLTSLDSLVNLVQNSTVNITINIPEGYEVDEFKVDNQVVNLDGALTYALTVTDNHNVTVTFKAIPSPEKYTVTLNEGLTSSDPLENLLVNAVVNIVIDVPNGYEIDEFKVDNQVVDLDGALTYALTVTDNHNVTVTFKAIPEPERYTVTLNEGLTSSDSLENLLVNSVVNITITVPDGYEVDEFKVDNQVVNLDGALTYALTVTDNHSVTVTFKVIPEPERYTVTLNEGLTSSDPLENLLVNAVVNITIDVPDGYEVDEFKVDNQVVNLDGALTYALTVTDNHSVTVTFKVIPEPETYTITWKNGGEVIKVDTGVEYNTMPEYIGDVPKKDADAQYTYTFSGWHPTPTKVIGDATYEAIYSKVTNKYTITWKNYDGTLDLEVDEEVEYGLLPEYNGANPTKPSTPQYNYSFSGWEPEVSNVVGNQTYTPKFTETPILYTVTIGDNLSTSDNLINIFAETKVTININLPDGKEVDEFKVDENIVNLEGALSYELTVTGNNHVSVSLKDIVYTLSYVIDDGENPVFTFTENYLHNQDITSTNIFEKTGINEWNKGLEPFVFGGKYTYLEDITLTKTVLPLSADKFEYDLIDGKAFIKLIKNSIDDTVIIIPDNINALSVGGFIDFLPFNSVFENKEKVMLIKLPNTMTKIGNYTFKGEKKLREVALSNTLVEIGKYAFSETGLVMINLPKSLKNIYSYAFYKTPNLKAVNFADNSELLLIETKAFGQSAITSFKLANDVDIIGKAVFSGTPLLNIILEENCNRYSLIDGVLFTNDKKTLVYYPLGILNTSYDVPNNVTKIDSNAFEGNNILTTISLPSSLLTISSYAFLEASSLNEVTFREEANLTTIGNYAFHKSNIANITLPNTLTHLGISAFSETNITSIIIPSSVIHMNRDIFASVIPKTTVYVNRDSRNLAWNDNWANNTVDVHYQPNWILGDEGNPTVIEVSLLKDNLILFTDPNLESLYQNTNLKLTAGKEIEFKVLLTIDDEVETLTLNGANIYDNLYTLENFRIIVPNVDFNLAVNLKPREYTLTYNVTSLNEVVFTFQEKYVFGEQVKDTYILNETGLSNWADADGTPFVFDSFYEERADITLFSNVEPLTSNKFQYDNVDGKAIITKILNSDAGPVIIVPDTIDGLIVGGIADIANHQRIFETMHQTYLIKLPNTITKIGDYNFILENKLKQIILPSNLVEIGNGSFKDSSLTKIYIPNTVTKIGALAFYQTYNLKEVVFQENSQLELIERRAFEGSGITSFKIVNDADLDPNGVFEYCTSIERFEIEPNSDKYSVIDGVLFSKDGTRLLQYPGGKKDLSYLVPDAVNKIETSAFAGSEFIKELLFSPQTNLTEIGNHCFSASKINKVSIPNTVTTIGAAAFGSTNSLEYLIVPSSVLYVSNGAFNGKTVYIDLESAPDSWDFMWDMGIQNSYFKPNWYIDDLGVPHVIEVNVTKDDTIDFIDSSFEGNPIKAGLNVGFKITPPIGKQVTSLLVNGEEKVSLVSDNEFYIIIPITDVTITAEFDYIPYTITYNVNEGKFIFTQVVTYDTIVTSDYIIEETNLTNWLISDTMESFIFNEKYNRTSNLTLKAYLEPFFDYEYTINGEVATITKINNAINQKLVVIPEEVMHEGVLYVVENVSPTENNSIFTLKNSVRHVYIPNVVKNIGNYAFYNEYQLRTVKLQQNLLTIGEKAFANNGLTSITIPQTVTSIGNEAFANTENLELVEFLSPSSLATIGNKVFAYSALKAFKVPNNVDIYAKSLFIGANSLLTFEIAEGVTNYKVIDGVLFSSDESILIAYPNGKTNTEYLIPNTVIIIEPHAFMGNQYLTKIVIPTEIFIIETQAFANIPNLTKVILPMDYILMLKEDAFSSSPACVEVYVDSNYIFSGVMLDDVVAIYYKPNWELVDGLPQPIKVKATLPESVSLTDELLDADNLLAGTDVEYLITVPLGKYVKSLIVNGSDETNNITNNKFNFVTPTSDFIISVEFADIVYTLNYVICDIEYNQVFTIKQEFIHNEIVSDEFILEETNISSWDFAGAAFVFGTPYTYLTDITLMAVVETLPESAFTWNQVEDVLFVTEINNPTNMKVIIMPNTLDGKNVNFISGNDGSSVFVNKNISRYIKLPNTLEVVGQDAFKNEMNLRSVVLPTSLAFIENYAFYGTSIKELTIPKTVIGIANYAFADNNSLSSVTFADEANSELIMLGTGAFMNTGLNTFKLVKDVDIVGKNVLSGCLNLETIEIIEGSSRYSVDENGVLFTKDGKTLILYPGGLTLTAYSIPSGVEYIDIQAFYAQKYLKEVTLNEELKVIHADAFKAATNLEKVNVPLDGALEQISTSVFSETNLNYFIVPDSVTTIGEEAFSTPNSQIMVYVNAEESKPDFHSNWQKETAGVHYLPNWTLDDDSVPYVIEVNVDLPETISLVDQNLDNTKLLSGTDVELQITIPDLKQIKTLTVNGVDYKTKLDLNNRFIVKIAQPTIITLEYEYIPFYITYSVNDGLFTVTEEVTYGENVEEAYIINMMGVLDWYLDGVKVEFPYLYNHLEDKVFTATVETFDSSLIEVSIETVNSTLGLVITKINNASTEKVIILPEYIANLPVLGIRNVIFKNNAHFIKLPDTMLFIGKYAFAYEIIFDIKLASNLVSIGESAFENCLGLKSITLPNSVTTISERAFSMSTLEEIIITDNSMLTTIGKSAFNGTHLKEFKVTNNLELVGKGVFDQTKFLERFLVSAGNTNYWVDEFGVLYTYDKTILVAYPSGNKRESYVVNDLTQIIDVCAIKGVNNLRTLTLPSSLTTILSEGLAHNYLLEDLIIPDDCNLTTIGARAFAITKLSFVNIPNTVTSIGEYAFYGSSFPNKCVIVPSSVTEIGRKAFTNDAGDPIRVFVDLETKPEGWAPEWDNNTLGVHFNPNWYLNETFIPQYKTVNVTLPDTVTLVNADLNHEELIAGTDVEFRLAIPTGKRIKVLTVNGANRKEDVNEEGIIIINILHTGVLINLEYEYIPYTLTYAINDGLFTVSEIVHYGQEITDDFVKEEFGSLSWYLDGELVTFSYTYNHTQDKTFTATVDPIDVSKLDYDVIGGFFIVLNKINNGDDKVVIISNRIAEKIISYTKDQTSGNLFTNTVHYVALPNSIENIGDNTFRDQEYLREVKMSSGLTSIGKNAFLNCQTLTSITIPSNVSKIDDYAFKDTFMLEEIIFEPNDVLTEIGTEILEFSGIKRFKLVNDINIIDKNLFSNTPNLEEFIIEDDSSLYSVVDGVLFTKDLLTLISYPMGKKDLSYIIPEGTITIGKDAFRNNSYLTSVTIPQSVELVKNDAFRNATSITDVIIPEDSNLETIYSMAFAEMTSLTRFNIPNKVQTINYATFWMTDLEFVIVPISVVNTESEIFGYVSGNIYIEALSEPEGWDDFWDINLFGNVYYMPNWRVVDGVPELIKVSVTMPEVVTLVNGSLDSNNLVSGSTVEFSIIVPDGKYVKSLVVNGENITEEINEFNCFEYVIPPTNFTIFVEFDNINYTLSYQIKDASNNIFFTLQEQYIHGATITSNYIVDETAITAWKIGEDDFIFGGLYNYLEDITLTTIVEPLHYSLIDFTPNFDEHYLYFNKINNDIDTKVVVIPHDIMAGFTKFKTIDFESENLFLNPVHYVVLPSGLEYLGNKAFSNQATREVKFVESLKTIGEYAFENCSNLTKVTLPNGLETIKEGAFKNTSLEHIIIPNSVKAIYASAFSNITTLESVILPMVETLAHNIFYQEVPKVRVYVTGEDDQPTWPENWSANTLSVHYLPNWDVDANNIPYYLTINLELPETISLVDQTLDITCLMAGSLVELEIAIPEFKQIKTLKVNNVDIKNSVTNNRFTIKIEPPQTVIELVYEYIPFYITYNVNDGQFTKKQQVTYGCSVDDWFGDFHFGTSTWYLDGTQVSFPFDYNYLYDLVFTTTIAPIDKTIIDYEVTSNLYEEYITINRINVGYDNKVVIIPDYIDGIPVYNTKDLTSGNLFTNNVMYVALPDTMVVLGNRAFANQMMLEQVKLSNNLVSIGESAFDLCVNLTQIIIPKSVQVIKQKAFYRNEQLRALIFEQDSGLSLIEKEAFCHCINIKTIMLPSSLLTIEDGAFADTNMLEEVLFAENSELTTLGKNVFFGSGIKYFKLVNDVDVVGKEVFTNASSLLGFEIIPNSNKYYVDEHGVLYSKDKTILIAYPGGRQNESYTILSGTQIIDKSAFEGAFYLSHVTLSNTVTTISDKAFQNTLNLTTITFAENSSLSYIGKLAFRQSALINLILPEGLTTIKQNAFKDNYSLVRVVIPATVTTIEADVFFTYFYNATLFVDLESAPSSWDLNWANGTKAVCYQPHWEYAENGLPKYKDVTVTYPETISLLYPELYVDGFKSGQTVEFKVTPPSGMKLKELYLTNSNGVISILDRVDINNEFSVELLAPTTEITAEFEPDID